MNEKEFAKKIFEDKLTFSLIILGILFFIFSAFNMFKISLGNNFVTQIINIFSPTIWILLAITLILSSILAYFKKYKLMALLLLIALIIITATIRTSNINDLKDMSTGDWTLGPDLDPFLYLRHANEIINGTLENPDMMRAAPLGANNYAYQSLMPWAIVLIWKIVSIFNPISVTYAAIIAPVIFFCISILGFFLFVYFLSLLKFSKKISMITAIFASTLYSIIPSMVARTVAGDPEIESLGMVWFWFAFLFYILAWRREEINYKVGLAVIAGIFTGLMYMTWGGYRYIYMVISMVAFILFLFEKDKKENIIIFSSWAITSIGIEIIKGGQIQSLFMRVSDIGFAIVVLLFLITDWILSNTEINKRIKIINLPKPIISIILIGILAFIFLIIFNRELLFSFLSRLVEGFLYPWGRERIGLTVAENRAPYFIEALGEFGNLTWIFLIGTVFLFYQAIKHFKKEKESDFEKWIFITISAGIAAILFYVGRVLIGGDYASMIEQIDFLILLSLILSLVGAIYFFMRKNINSSLNFSFLFFILALIFSRVSPQSSRLNGESLFSQGIYFSGLILFGGLIGIIIILAYKNKDGILIEKFKKINLMYIILLVFSFWGIISIRGAIRLFFIISPMIVLVSSFILAEVYNQKKEKNKKIIWGAIIIFILIFSQLFASYTLQTQYTSKAMIPSAYHQQWQGAMQWIRDNTPKESIFIHWWDYGYWVQTIGERATVVDGGHQWGYWDHLVGRYVLTATSPEMILSAMKTYNASYLLIDSSDIGKYPAFSKIGSDKNGEDRYSQIPIFAVDDSQTRETSNKTIRVYTGGGILDEDIIYTPEEDNSNEIFLPKEKSYLIFILIELTKEGEENILEQPKAIYYFNNQQISIPVRYLYYGGELFDYEGGLNATISLIPKINPIGNNQMQSDGSGAAIYISPKVTKTAFAQLYLLENYAGRYSQFQLVHSEQDLYINYLKSMGMDIEDFVYISGNIRGPIKIWESRPEENILTHEEFLKTSGEYAELDNLEFVRD